MKLKNAIALNPKERCEYFIREAAQFEQIWTLSTDEGYVIFKDQEGDQIFPVWPHEEIAEKCMFAEHREIGAAPVAISVESFLNNCIPDMLKENILFGVFYDHHRQGLALNGTDLGAELQGELGELWGE